MSDTIKIEPESSVSSALPQSSNSRNQDPTSFCALCLRKRPPSEQFYKYNPENSTTFCEAMVDILGYPFWQECFAVCRSCWSMVQLIEHFRKCCFVARAQIERHVVGLKTEDDDWLSGGILERIEYLQMAIQNQAERLGTSKESVAEIQSVSPEVSLDKIKVESTEIENNTTDGNFVAIVSMLSTDGDVEHSKGIDAPPELDADLKPMETEYPECLHCQEIFDTEAELQEHSQLCEAEESDQGGKFTCPICSATFDNFKDVAAHIGSHKDSKSCEKVFTTEELKSTHEEAKRCTPQKILNKYQVHNNGVFRCETCRATFWSTDELMKHVNKKHPSGNQLQNVTKVPYVCPSCPARFVQRSALEIHQKKTHRKPPWKCQHCDEKFVKNIDLVRHRINDHLKPKLQNRVRMECGNSGETIAAKKSLHCPQCSEEFKNTDHLTEHILTHMKKKVPGAPEKAHVCKYCGKKYMYESWLHKHVEMCHIE